MKKWLFLLVSIVVLISLGTFLVLENRNVTASIVWKYFKFDTLALITNKDNHRLPMEMGLYYFNGGAYDLEKAKNAFLQALSIKETASWAHFQLGRIYFIQGNFYTAISELEKELEVHGDHKRTYYVLGLVYGYLPGEENLRKAEESFTRFSEAYPGEWAGYNDLAWIQIRLKKFSEAKETIRRGFTTVLSTEKTNPWMWTMLGVAELNLKHYTESKEAFLTARSLSDTMTPEYFWSAYPGNNKKNAGDAFDQFKATLSFNLGLAYENLGIWKEAKKEYQSYLALLPQGSFPTKEDVEQKITTLDSYAE